MATAVELVPDMKLMIRFLGVEVARYGNYRVVFIASFAGRHAGPHLPFSDANPLTRPFGSSGLCYSCIQSQI